MSIRHHQRSQSRFEGGKQSSARRDAVRVPEIVLEGAESYYTPRELYAKSLINTPIEFGTKTIRRDAPELEDGPGTRGFRVWEVDVAMHLHRGALVCGMATAPPETSLEEQIVETVERLEEARQVLIEALEEFTWSGWTAPPVGLFVVAPEAERRKLPERWNEGRARVCPGDDPGAIGADMMEAMKSAGGGCGIEDWQRFGALVRTVGPYTSGLEWLLEFEAI